MPKPQIIRADTIDLQDRENPSAQDHSNSNLRNTASSPVAPHQAETLREVAHEIAEENLRSPRLALDRGVGAIDDDHHHDDDHHDYHHDHDSSDYDDSDNFGDGHHGPNSANSRGARDRPDEDIMRDQDALAVAQNGGMHDDSDMDLDGDDDFDDDMTGGISSSPSIEDEDIDFEYVYALHTFVATVEGQANATKGDTMVLLDDSNSYWWLVRIVKDSSIGYLPAEHIETPTERLARLNKHRNIDLSATMLQDTSSAEKSKSSFTIRRRKKNVTFAAPTYVDYSDFDYSSDDDDDQEEIFAQQQLAAQQAREQQASAAESQGLDSDSDDSSMNDETAKVEPLKPRAAKESTSAAASDPTSEDASKSEALKRASEDMFDGKAEGVSRSRNGTVRNTDSFFKDDTVETKKITLTPNLLRDDNTPRASTESSSKELRQRPSLDKVSDRDLIMGTGAAAAGAAGAATNGKEDKKKGAKDKKDKDKRPSVIRNFFSRKDKKKGGAGGDDEDDVGKRSMDSGEPRDSRDTDEGEADTTAAAADPGGKLQRTPSKLQKQQPRIEPSPKQQKPTELTYVHETRNDISNMPPTTMRIVDAETQEAREVSSAQPLRDDTARAPSRGEEYAATRQAGGPHKPTLVTSQSPAASRLSESPIEVSPVSPLAPGQPPPLMVDSSSQDGHSASPSPELLDGDDKEQEAVSARGAAQQRADATPTAGEPAATWNDAKLRAFFDSGTDIRDMLMVVLDKSDVAPAGPDHPIVGGLFREQNAKLAEITTQLDNMLGDWLARKQRLRGTI